MSDVFITMIDSRTIASGSSRVAHTDFAITLITDDIFAAEI
ncbi:hypothetical protein [Novosphingobium sp. AP12]|nr:hypothetical protein [Novosphingobium sp. AP12]